MVRQRRTGDTANVAGAASASKLEHRTTTTETTTEQEPEMADADARSGSAEPRAAARGGLGSSWSSRTTWIFFAVASGACAAFNGVFAKLTTTNLTSSLSHKLAALLGLSSAESAVEFTVRGIFFALNLTFNGIMWTLFTTALAKGTSTTQVSIMNTSTNFVLTALLGLLIFSEALPPLWWAGAALLVAGNVIVGRKDESKDGLEAADGAEADPLVEDPDHEGLGVYKDDVDEDVVDLGDLPSEAGR